MIQWRRAGRCQVIVEAVPTVALLIELGTILVAYLIGCLSPGYWIVRWRTGTDIRQRFTGSTGARNVGRVTGRTGLVVTVILDVAKGALAVLLARALGLGDGWLAAAAAAVVAGHIWPAPLRFHGGRGLSPAIGALAVLHPPAAILIAIVAGLMFAITRWPNLAALAAATATPYLALITGASPAVIIGAGVLALLVVVAQLELLAAIRRRVFPRRVAGDGEPTDAAPGNGVSFDQRSTDG